jgi:hypothetical protein
VKSFQKIVTVLGCVVGVAILTVGCKSRNFNSGAKSEGANEVIQQNESLVKAFQSKAYLTLHAVDVYMELRSKREKFWVNEFYRVPDYSRRHFVEPDFKLPEFAGVLTWIAERLQIAMNSPVETKHDALTIRERFEVLARLKKSANNDLTYQQGWKLVIEGLMAINPYVDPASPNSFDMKTAFELLKKAQLETEGGKVFYVPVLEKNAPSTQEVTAAQLSIDDEDFVIFRPIPMYLVSITDKVVNQVDRADGLTPVQYAMHDLVHGGKVASKDLNGSGNLGDPVASWMQESLPVGVTEGEVRKVMDRRFRFSIAILHCMDSFKESNPEFTANAKAWLAEIVHEQNDPLSPDLRALNLYFGDKRFVKFNPKFNWENIIENFEKSDFRTLLTPKSCFKPS